MAGLLVATVFLCRDTLVFGGVFYNRDIHLNWISQVEGVVRSYAAGSWPVWDPSPGFGQPLLADAGAEVFYPFAWLNLILKPWVYYTWFVATHALFASFCLYLLARRWGLTQVGALTAAMLWLFSGPYISLVNLWQHFASASWMPAVVLAFDWAAEVRSPRAILVAASTLAGQILAGSADVTAMTLAIVVGDLLVIGLARSNGPGSSRAVGPWLSILGSAACVGLVAVGLTACLWLPAAEVASRSARSNLPLEIRTYWSVHPLGLVEALVPGLWELGRLSPEVERLLFEGRDRFLGTLYLGVPALGLVGLGLVRPRARQVYLAAALVVSVLLALGRHTPVYGWVTALLPPLQIFRFPVKAMIVAAFAWSLLAGFGCDRALVLGGATGARSPRAPFFPLRLFTAVALAVAGLTAFRPDLVSSLVLDLDGSYSVREMLRPLVVRTALAGGVGLLMLMVPLVLRGGRRRALAWAFLAAGELAIQHRDPDPVAPRAFYDYRPEVLKLLAPLGTTRVYVYDYLDVGKSLRYLGRPFAFQARRPRESWSEGAASALALQGSLVPQTAGRWGLRQGYDLDYRNLFPRLLTELGRALRDVEGTPVHLRLLRIGGITHVVALHRETFKDLIPVGTVMTPSPLFVFAVPQTLPRVYAVSGVRVADGIDAFRVLSAPEFDPWREVVLPVAEAAARPPGPGGTVRVLKEQPDRLLVEATMADAGYVVVLDTFDPGWRATLDGTTVPVLAANAVFRAVLVPGGRHVLEMVYRPRALYVGLIVSASTALGAALAALVLSRRSAVRRGAANRATSEG